MHVSDLAPWSYQPISIEPKLEHTNYPVWQLKTRTILESSGLFGLVDGSESPEQLNIAEMLVWRRRDGCARLQIMHNVPDGWLWILSSVRTAAAAWQALDAHFNQRSSFRATDALARFHAARLGDGGDVPAHLQRMGALWAEVLAADACPDEKHPDTYFARQLLASLPPTWAEFVEAWKGERVGSATVIGRMLDSDRWNRARREKAGAGARKVRAGKAGEIARHVSEGSTKRSVDDGPWNAPS